MVDESPPRRSTGSVAEETARLLDALFSGEEGPSPAPRQASPPDVPPDETAETQPRAEGERDAEPGTRHTDVCGSCGQRVGANTTGAETDPAAGVCHLCPVCQLISAVRSVRPETVDRLADLAAALTSTLRDVATSRWAETGQPGAQRHRSTVEDIDVHDDDPDDPDDKETPS